MEYVKEGSKDAEVIDKSSKISWQMFLGAFLFPRHHPLTKGIDDSLLPIALRRGVHTFSSQRQGLKHQINQGCERKEEREKNTKSQYCDHFIAGFIHTRQAWEDRQFYTHPWQDQRERAQRYASRRSLSSCTLSEPWALNFSLDNSL